MNDARRFPWLSGLIAATVIALWLLYVVLHGVVTMSVGVAAVDG
ncbi:hypothetical protein [Mycobacterium paragordonae]|jgi:hypothetical protein|nr:hypothetical protein [Mycobacterium paragordonae]